MGSGQVLLQPYPFDKARLIVQEMTDLLVLDLVDKNLVTDHLVLTVGYDILNLTDPGIRAAYKGEVTSDYYGRQVPKHAHGTVRLETATSSSKIILQAVTKLFEEIVDEALLVRRINIAAGHVVSEATYQADRLKSQAYEQLDLFTDYEEEASKNLADEEARTKERQVQQAMLDIKKKYGKNAILKGMNLQEGAMTVERNRQIGGHKA